MADDAIPKVKTLSLGEESVVSATGQAPRDVGTTAPPTSESRKIASSCSGRQPGQHEHKEPSQLSICPSCLQHSSHAEFGDSPGRSKLEEFMRRSALHMINAAKPQH